MVVFDTATILLAIDPRANPPIDPSTSQPVTHCKERIEHLLRQLSTARTRVLIPTPVLSEFLVGAGPDKGKFLEEFMGSHAFTIAPFDQRAAIELAYLTENDNNSNRIPIGITSKAKIKFDRQIVAIAKVAQASKFYTDDGDLAILAKNNGMSVVMTWEIPLPPNEAQGNLVLDEPSE
jgi:predicted nucleic acid-binding protein